MIGKWRNGIYVGCMRLHPSFISGNLLGRCVGFFYFLFYKELYTCQNNSGGKGEVSTPIDNPAT